MSSKNLSWIYVMNVEKPKNANEYEEMLRKCGHIGDLIVTHHGHSCYIGFQNSDDAEYAIKMYDGVFLSNERIHVEKSSKPDSGNRTHRY